MKNILCLLFVLIPQFVQAVPMSVNFTGVSAQLFDIGLYCQDWYGAGGGIYFGGPGGFNLRGGAEQFTISTRSVVEFVSSDLYVSTAYSGAINNSSSTRLVSAFQFVFYNNMEEQPQFSGTVPFGQIQRSEVVRLFGVGNHIAVSSEFLDLTLEAGTYWIGVEEYYASPIIASELTYVDRIQIRGHTAVPEPSSVVLSGMGLVPLYVRWKKVV